MATDGLHHKAAEAYKQLRGQVFSGFYRGIYENNDYGTERAVYEVDEGNPNNGMLLALLNKIRKWNSYSQTVVSSTSFFVMYSGGSRIPRRGGRGPSTWALFGKNVCENERIGSRRGRAPGTPPRSVNVVNTKVLKTNRKDFTYIYTLVHSNISGQTI